MRRFIKKLLLFPPPVILIFLLLELFLRRMPTSYKVKEEQLAQCSKHVELLILGNSHATYGLDPAMFSMPAFNLAQVSQSLYYDRRITEKYLDQMKDLKYVLLSIDFHSLYFSDEGYRNLWTWYGYGVDGADHLPLLSKCSYAIGYQPKFSLEFLKRSFSRKYDSFQALDVEQGVDLLRPITNGYFAYKDSTDLSPASLQKRATEFNEMVHKTAEKTAVMEDLEIFLLELKARGITPILVTLPCYAPYIALLDKQVQAQNQMDIQYLTDHYGIQYWDYFTMPVPPDYFYNCDHLNEKGAVYMSGLINERLGHISPSFATTPAHPPSFSSSSSSRPSRTP